jgi:DNA polymerase III psi subunit
MSAYVYRHIRLDKNEPFYIGIGRTENYSRAYNKVQRSNQWKSIASNGYEIEILFDDLTWEQACEKEKEFIKLYGRIDKKNGTLINFTDGGEGIVNYVYTEEARKKISLAQMGNQNWKLRNPTDEWKRKIAEKNKGKKRTQEFKDKLSASMKGEKNHNYGKKLSEQHRQRIIETRERKPVLQFDLNGNFIKEWSSKKECMRSGFNELGIWGCCNNTRKTHMGYIWKYKN